MNFLIISANKKLAHSIKSEFGEVGYRIRYVPNGELGLEIAQKVRFDLIVLDWRHPKEDDLRVLAELGQINLTPILILVAEDSIREIILSLNYCAYTCLTMPMEDTALIDRIKALIPTVRWNRSVDIRSDDTNFDLVAGGQKVIEEGGLPLTMERTYNSKRQYRMGSLWKCLVDDPIRCPNLISYGSEKFCLGKEGWDLVPSSDRQDDH